MITQNIHLRHNARAQLPVPPRAAQAGLAAAALVLLAACGSAGNGSGGSGSGGSGGGGADLTPRQALLAAASSTRNVTSAIETLSVKATGSQSEDTSGTIQVQLKPSLQLAANLSISVAGKKTKLKEVLVGKTLYFSAPELTGSLGKPWVKIDVSSLSGAAGASFAALFHSLENNSFTNQTELFTVAKNARRVGTGTVDGSPATEYAGSIKASEALKTLSPSLRKALTPVLQQLGSSTIKFHMWIDDQNHVRKIIETEVVSGETIDTTVDITAFNQPVHITVPPASQTTTPPGM